MFYVIVFSIFVLIFFSIYIYTSKSISKYGFNNINIFILIYSVFYIIVPFFVIFFKKYRDETTIYNQLLNQFSDNYIFLNSMICLIFLIIIITVYHLESKKKPVKIEKEKIDYINSLIYRKIDRKGRCSCLRKF